MGTSQEGAYAPIAIVAFLAAFGYYLYRERNKKTNTAIESKSVKT